ncbi:hypothetical protein B0J13DRAFT_651576 [Dactylonectria estremocensis]|uniref:Histidine-specific methyltransferase SAM-dependent domain-containing protein n=1 Tax=Dactylonectria estremocensis TaxID=1079267 RepID=A0A9P9DHT7_9HYPO|nr:hypothetical protein B0J13DRAFT_651576 [Dactylonectria estremocensis]
MTMNTQATPNHWPPCRHGETFDIGGDKSVQLMKEEFVQGLWSGKPLPKALLYALSPHLWKEVSQEATYYQTHEELAILKRHCDEIVPLFSAGMTIIDIGAGQVHPHDQQALVTAGLKCTYIAIDISCSSMAQSISALAKEFDASLVYILGLHGTFEDGMKYCISIPGPRLFLSLGSTICNKPYPEAVKDLQGWSKELGQEDALLFGQDAHTLDDIEKIERAYHGPAFVAFIESIRTIAYQLTGKEVFDQDKWELTCSFSTGRSLCHKFELRAKQKNCFGYVYEAGMKVDCFASYKHDQQRVKDMCKEAGLRVQQSWDNGSEMCMCLSHATSSVRY